MYFKSSDFGLILKEESYTTYTAQKMNFSIKDFFSKSDQIRSFLRIWSHLLSKSLMENFIFCAVCCLNQGRFTEDILNGKLNILCKATRVYCKVIQTKKKTLDELFFLSTFPKIPIAKMASGDLIYMRVIISYFSPDICFSTLIRTFATAEGCKLLQLLLRHEWEWSRRTLGVSYVITVNVVAWKITGNSKRNYHLKYFGCKYSLHFGKSIWNDVQLTQEFSQCSLAWFLGNIR